MTTTFLSKMPKRKLVSETQNFLEIACTLPVCLFWEDIAFAEKECKVTIDVKLSASKGIFYCRE